MLGCLYEKLLNKNAAVFRVWLQHYFNQVVFKSAYQISRIGLMVIFPSLAACAVLCFSESHPDKPIRADHDERRNIPYRERRKHILPYQEAVSACKAFQLLNSFNESVIDLYFPYCSKKNYLSDLPQAPIGNTSFQQIAQIIYRFSCFALHILLQRLLEVRITKRL
jgi:hypothetical protein